MGGQIIILIRSCMSEEIVCFKLFLVSVINQQNQQRHVGHQALFCIEYTLIKVCLVIH